MNAEKAKNRLTHLINEAEKFIEEAKKAGDDKIRIYYEGSLYCATMMLLAMDCTIKFDTKQKIVIDKQSS